MIYTNAQIRFARKVGDGEPDEYGMPTFGIEHSDPISCMQAAVRNDMRGRFADGQFRQSLHRVHILIDEAPEWVEQSSQAELTTTEGTSLGVFSVQSVTKAVLLDHYEIELGESYA